MVNKYKLKQRGGKFEWDSDDSTNASKVMVFGIVVIFIGVILFTVADNPDALSTNTYTYAMVIVIPLLISAYYLSNSETKIDPRNLTPKQISILIGAAFLIPVTWYIFQYLSTANAAVLNFFVNIFVFVAIIVALAIFYKMFIDKLRSLEGFAGFVVSFIFYIPCLLTDFLEYLFNEYKITPNIVFILFIIEILVVLLCFYLPRLGKKLVVSNSTVLQNDAVFLDSVKTTIGKSSDLYTPVSMADTTIANANYSLSMWIYINPGGASDAAYTKENGTEIFSYSFTDAGGVLRPKPRITYSNSVETTYNKLSNQIAGNGTDHLVDKFHLYLSDESIDPVEVTVVGQRWNQFVFNYNNNMADVFVNGNLVRTVNVGISPPMFDITDKITVGSPGGVKGAISCVEYNKPLTAFQIANSYNLRMGQNPPKI
jgi:Concanavalin A-like lectin/glucanases superfamily